MVFYPTVRSTYIAGSAPTTVLFEADQTIPVGMGGMKGTLVRRGVYEIDLSFFGHGDMVKTANLYHHLPSIGAGTGSNNFEYLLLLYDGDTVDITDISYDNKDQSGTVAWDGSAGASTSGTDYHATISTVLSHSSDDFLVWLSVDVTDHIQQAVTNGYSKGLLMMRRETESGAGELTIDTHEDAFDAPILRVIYGTNRRDSRRSYQGTDHRLLATRTDHRHGNVRDHRRLVSITGR